MSKFESILINSITTGVIDDELQFHLDEMLLWYTQIGDSKSSITSNVVLEKYREQELRALVEKIIDRLFISQSMASKRIFPLKMNEDAAKERYRKLIRVFHPDRGSNEQAWLNRRAEVINVAYEKHKELLLLGKGKAKNEYLTEPVHPKSKPNISRSNLAWGFFHKHAGEHRRYQRILVIGAMVLFSMVLLLGFLSTIEFESSPLHASVPQLDELSLSDDIQGKKGEAMPAAMMEIMGPESVDVEVLLETIDTEKHWYQKDSSPESQYQTNDGNVEAANNNATLKVKEKPNVVAQQSRIAKAITNSNDFNKKTKNNLNQSIKSVIEREVTHAVSTPPSLQTEYSVDEIHDLLNQYRRAFALGDTVKIMDLYLVSAVHDDKQGRLKIGRYFQELFHSTSSRSATLTPSLVVQDDYSGALVEGVFDMKMSTESQQLDWSNSKRFRLVLVRNKKKLKISSFKTI